MKSLIVLAFAPAALVGLSLAACNRPAGPGTTSSSGETEPPLCTPGEPVCINETTEGVCGDDSTPQYPVACTPGSVRCVESLGKCSCAPDTTQCDPQNDGVELVCNNPGANGVYTFSVMDCPPGCPCNSHGNASEGSIGECTCLADTCTLGEYFCFDDQLYRCQQVPPANYLTPVSIINCDAYGMTCQKPSEPFTDAWQACFNDCLGHQPLDAEPCDESPDLGCAYLVCNTADGTLENDHTKCGGVGTPCVENRECVSCICDVALQKCVGGDPPPCHECK